jgi:uncharacterized protein YfaS (alpha-2-macroglobulin family)
VRKDFLDLAFWRASVRTGEDGRAAVQVALPDNLTTWTMDARAITDDTLVGQGTADVVATKPLLVRPALPRFFVDGDRVEIASIIHNTTGSDLEVAVSLTLEGLTASGPTSDSIRVRAGESYRAAWPVAVLAGAERAVIGMTVRAEDAGLHDALESTLPVLRYSTPEVSGTSGQVGPEETRLELAVLPEGIDPTRADLDVTLEPSLAAGMTGGLAYLEHYPFECVEQTLSRFLPNVVTYRALSELGLERPDLAKKLPGQVSVGLQRLYQMQRTDGGWGWWPSGQSNLFVSSYVLFGLAQARAAGFAVDPQVIARAAVYLQQALTTPGGLAPWQLNQQAFLLYALAEAGYPEPNRAGALYESRAGLSHFGRAYLALALDSIGDEAADARIRTLLAELSGSAKVSATSAHWEEEFVDYRSMNTNLRSTAVVLDALAKLNPDSALAPGAVRWLMEARRADRWENTQENTWAILALTDWMAATGELEGEYAWRVLLNAAELGAGSVQPSTVSEVTRLHADMDLLLADDTNALEISRGAGPGRLYYTAHLKTYLPIPRIRPEDRGFTIARSYRSSACVVEAALLAESSGQPAEECPSVQEARVGDALQVLLTLTVPEESHYVVVEDPLPAGVEAIDTSLRATSLLASPPELRPGGDGTEHTAGWWWIPQHVELRDEKAVLFAESLAPGTYQFTYQVRAGLRGVFGTMPPTATAMYFPERWGRGAGMTFTIR